LHPIGDAGHRQLFGNAHHMQDNGVARRVHLGLAVSRQGCRRSLQPRPARDNFVFRAEPVRRLIADCMALLTIAVGTAKRRHDRRDYPVSLLQVIEIPVSPVIGPGPASPREDSAASPPFPS
jgi:hypothetical protein